MRGRCRVGTEIGFARLQEAYAEKKITIYADNISQYVVQDNINTSPYKGFFIRSHTPLVIPIKLHIIHFFTFFGLTDSPSPYEKFNPFCGGV